MLQSSLTIWTESWDTLQQDALQDALGTLIVLPGLAALTFVPKQSWRNKSSGLSMSESKVKSQLVRSQAFTKAHCEGVTVGVVRMHTIGAGLTPRLAIATQMIDCFSQNKRPFVLCLDGWKQ
jgi:hypothetical protein